MSLLRESKVSLLQKHPLLSAEMQLLTSCVAVEMNDCWVFDRLSLLQQPICNSVCVCVCVCVWVCVEATFNFTIHRHELRLSLLHLPSVNDHSSTTGDKHILSYTLPEPLQRTSPFPNPQLNTTASHHTTRTPPRTGSPEHCTRVVSELLFGPNPNDKEEEEEEEED